MIWHWRRGLFKGCIVKKKYFEQFVQSDSSYIKENSNVMIFRRDLRNGPFRGFTSLMYSILYGRQDLLFLFQREVYMKTICQNVVQINDENITIPKDSTVLHIAILTRNVNIINDVIKLYNRCAHNTDYTSLFQPNLKGKTNLNYIIDSNSLQIAQTIFQLQYQPAIEFQNPKINLFKAVLSNPNLELVILQYISNCARCFKTSEIIQDELKPQTQEIYNLLNKQIRASQNCLNQLDEVRIIIDNLILGKAKTYGCPQLVDNELVDNVQNDQTPQDNISIVSLQSQTSITTEQSNLSQCKMRASRHYPEEVNIKVTLPNQEENYMHRIISINQYAKSKEQLPKIDSEDTVYSCVSRPTSYQDLKELSGLSDSSDD